MNLLFASSHCCIRCVKQGLALMDRGHTIIFLQRRVANTDMQNVLPVLSFYSTLDEYKAKLALYDEIDLIHVHNEPSELGWIAKETRPDLPVVFDCHDLNAVRSHDKDYDEIKSIEDCDAVIFPSKGYQSFCLKDFTEAFPGLSNKPNDVVYSMCTSQMIDAPPFSRVPGIVYEGRVGLEGQKNYRPIIRELASKGILFNIFPTQMDCRYEYVSSGAIVGHVLPFMLMLRSLSRYDWGFVGPAVRSRQGDTGMPNKLFEYIAAGIPVLAYQNDEVGRYVEEHGVGIVVNSSDEIISRYNMHKDLRHVVLDKRREFTMDNEIDKVVALYERVLK